MLAFWVFYAVLGEFGLVYGIKCDKRQQKSRSPNGAAALRNQGTGLLQGSFGSLCMVVLDFFFVAVNLAV